jgi:hypothetical protein
LATTQQKLDQAKEAKHKLATGQLARVFMDQNGERVEFTTTNMAQLDRYIAELQSEIGGINRFARKPIGFIF